ncbi:hypothetical protein ACOME3_007026 [Neoechinorhynchus agilis]
MDYFAISKRKLGVDLASLSIAGATWAGVYYGAPYTHQGFDTCDKGLRLPYRASRVPVWLDFIISVVVPLFTCLGINCFHLFKARKSLESSRTQTFQFMSRTVRIDAVWLLLYEQLYHFIFGIAGLCVITEILKKTAGELRPYFWEACTPNYNGKLYNGSCQYVTEYECINSNHLDNYALSEVRKSFPSNHAASTFFSMIFTAAIIQMNWIWDHTKSLAYFLVIGFMAIAFYVSATRIIDNKHFPHDVLFGAILGSVIGYLSGRKSKNVTALM